MEQHYDRKLLLGLPRRVFLTTDFIAYTVIIPFTALMSYFMIDITGTQTIIYFSAILLLIGAACTVTVVSYRKLFSPILLYFNAILESREVTDKEFYLAKKTFFSLSRRRCLEALISWCILMPAGMLLVVLLFHPTLKAIVIIMSLFFINTIAMSCIYYLAIDFNTRRIARTGIFSRMAEGEEKLKTRMSTSLALVIISFIAVFCGLVVPVAYIIIDKTVYGSRLEQMNIAVSLINGRAAAVFDSDIDDRSRLQAGLRDAVTEARGNDRYAVIVATDGTIIAHPDESMVFKKASEFPWGPRVLAADEGCFDFMDGTSGEPMIACGAKNRAYSFKVAYITSRAEIDGLCKTIVLVMVGFAAVMLVTIGFGIYRLITYRLAPIEECRVVIEETGRGNLHQDVISYSTDEPGNILLTMSSFLAQLRGVVASTQGVSGDLASASLEMSATAESFSANAQHQASTAEEVTATAEEVSAGVDKIADDTQRQYEGITLLLSQIRDLDRSINETSAMIREAADVSSQISLKAREGEQSLTGMNSAMTRIIQSSEEMTGIVKIINDISERINLLSLNAAIEAARAGDAGRGFAVVADEISKLADQTATSIKDIDRLIKANTEQIQSGMAYIGQTTRNIGSIIEGVTTITGRMGSLTENIRHQVEIKDSVSSEGDAAQGRSDQIRIATDEQKRAMDEIVRSITRINELTQSIAAGTEQMTANLKGIEQMAETLKEGIEYFKLA